MSKAPEPMKWEVTCKAYQTSIYDYEGWAHDDEWTEQFATLEEASARRAQACSGFSVSQPRILARENDRG